MIEETVLKYLEKNLPEPVYMEVPERPEKKYVIVEKTGSSREEHIDRSTWAVQSYADSLYEAAALNEKVKDVMEMIVEEDEICKCSLNSDYNFTDTTTKKYRYQAVFDLVHY